MVISFLKRLNAVFTGFTPQTVQIGTESTQMFLGQISFFEHKISIALFTRPTDKMDCIVLSRPLFLIPETGALQLFEQLLSWNNGATDMTHFAIDEPLNTINLVCFRTMVGLGFQEFQRCLESILRVAKNSANRLQSEYGLIRLP